MTKYKYKIPVVAALALSSCWWNAPPNDSGNDAFAAQAIEAILGRRPFGSDEVRALAELADQRGREAVVKVLFEEPDFVSYWSNVLADDLKIQREGGGSLDASCLAPPLLSPQHSAALAHHLATAPPDEPFCFGGEPPERDPMDTDPFWREVDRATRDYEFTRPSDVRVPDAAPVDVVPTRSDERAAGRSLEGNVEIGATRSPPATMGRSTQPLEPDWERWLEDYEFEVELPDVVICPPFNLTDMIEASVRADRLDAVYRGYLPVMATFPSTPFDDLNREELGFRFLDVYLDRETECLGCHTTTYSTTDARPLNGNWDRFHPMWAGEDVPFDPEGTVFTIPQGETFEYGGDGGGAVQRRVDNLFRIDNHVEGGFNPWGMHKSCATNGELGFGGWTMDLPEEPRTAAFAGVGPSEQAGALDIAVALSEGVASVEHLALDVPDWAAYRAAKGANTDPADPGCTLCHGVLPQAPNLNSKVGQMSDSRLFSIIRFGFGDMPPVKMTDQEAWDAVEWVRQNHTYSPALQMTDRNHAFTYMLSANIANQVMDEIMGEDLVMTHGFPRNLDQSNAMSELAPKMASGFSLQQLIEDIVLSEGFNRRAPDHEATEPYALQMLPYPEAEVHPTTLPMGVSDDANSEGDLVNRASPSALLQRVHTALGWPAPRIMGNQNSRYPSQELMTSLGRYTSQSKEEGNEFNLASYIAWEVEVASCIKPSIVNSIDILGPDEVDDPTDILFVNEWEDWIDLLRDEAEDNNYTLEEVAIAIKDRLHTDPTLDDDERQLLSTLWSQPSLDIVPWESKGQFVEGYMRTYCGVLLSSPQFVMRGVWTAGPESAPSMEQAAVCLPGELCGYADYYVHYHSTAAELGY